LALEQFQDCFKISWTKADLGIPSVILLSFFSQQKKVGPVSRLLKT
jgi:hypothetical protein